MFWSIHQVFREKLQKCGICEEPSKPIDLSITSIFRANYDVLGSHQVFSEKLQKVLDFVKNHQNLSIWPQLATFRANYHVLGFSSSFQRKVVKNLGFCEKPSKLMDLAKSSNFSCKLPCFRVLIKFSAKSCKKCWILRKTTKTHGFGQN